MRAFAILFLLSAVSCVGAWIYLMLGGGILLRDPQNGSFKPRKLESELSAPGCFYDEARQSYAFPGLEFGHGLEETIDQLGTRGWYTGRRLEDSLNFLEQGRGVLRLEPADRVNVNALGAVYTVTQEYSQNLVCYAVDMSANIVLREYKPSGVQYYTNIMSYDKACEYFYGLYEQLEREYGPPDEKDFEDGLSGVEPEKAESWRPAREVYARWISGEPRERAVLQLEGSVVCFESENGKKRLELGVMISVKQEIDGVSFDESRFLYPQLTSKVED